MSRPKPVRLVVDASIARAAGKGNRAANPPAPACIQALEIIQAQEQLRALFSKEVLDEWYKHASIFATKWLGNLKARKRFERLDVPRWEHSAAVRDAAFDLEGRGEAAVLKDLHMVELAMASDRRVVSLDDRQAALLGRLAATVPALGGLHWANPHSRAEVLPWLERCAPEEACLCIVGGGG